MRRGDVTRGHIIEQAAELFNRKGFAGASVSDVMSATGLQKGGIYRHFETKEQLALEAFDHAVGTMAERFAGAAREHSGAADRLRAFVQVFRTLVTAPPVPGGCPIVNTAVEADDGNEALRDRARRAMDALRGLVRTTTEKGVARRELRADCDPELLATVLVSTMEGAVILSRLYGDPVHVDRAAAHLDELISAREESPNVSERGNDGSDP